MARKINQSACGYTGKITTRQGQRLRAVGKNFYSQADGTDRQFLAGAGCEYVSRILGFTGCGMPNGTVNKSNPSMFGKLLIF